MSHSPLASARFSVDHAKSHVDEIDKIAGAFFKDDPYAFISEDDPLYPTRELRYLRPKPLPPRLIGLASDALVNLRSSLDQLGYAISVASGKSAKQAHFPFGDTPAEFESRRVRGSKNIPKEIFDVMAAFKPYKGGNDLLWSLNKLAGTRKHETLLRVDIHISEIVFRTEGTMLAVPPHPARSNGDIPIGWHRKGGTDHQRNLELSATIRFNDVGPIALNKPATAVLNKLCSTVEGIIMRIEGEAMRLGIIN